MVYWKLPSQVDAQPGVLNALCYYVMRPRGEVHTTTLDI